MKQLLLLGFSLLLATHAALAGQVMVKSLPAVTNGNATHYAGTVDTALPFGFPPSSASTSPPSPANPGTVPGSAPGFRSVSNPTHTFITGWCDMPPAGASRPRDGFISKVDPSGAVIWTRSMNGLIGSTAGSVGFLINDVAILAPFLYACGQTTDGKAFVAKLDYDGVVQDYTLIRDNGGSATARATGVCVTIVSGSSQVAVSGDFGANNLIVDQRRMTGGTSTFGTMNGRYSHNSNRDVFVLRMDTSLNATWATTLGFSPANDYATAIAADGAGNLFVAMNFQNPDGALASLSYSNIDDERNVMVPGSSTTITQTSTYNYDFNVGNWGTLVMINAQNGVGARIVHHSEPVKVDNSNNVNITNASSRIVDMEFSNGVINAVGEFSRNFRASSSANVNPSSGEVFGSMSNTYDVFVAQLDPTNLNWTRFVFLASGNDDFAGQITAGSDGLYVTGSAGAALSHRVPGSTITTLSGATARHLFWIKLNSTNLSYLWHVTPVELISSGYSVPSVMNSAGIGVVGNVAVISGYYNGGAMTMGTTGSYTTLPAPSVPLGFTGFLKTDGTWFEQVNVTIQSDYGLPSPYGGTQVLATGTAVRATVPQIVYEDEAGNVLDDSDPEIIRRDAVTRRVCTGYQFKSSSVNGTANVVDFVVNDDLVLNFLWRTEHALEILTNLPVGLTSQAAGTPSPAVNKHWLAENSPVIAQIDGAAYTDQDGVRYRSSGYTATGLAVPQGWLDGAFVPWSSFQLRQQVPQFTLTGPATITWQWQKEFRLRVSANASLASSAPYVDGVPVSTTTIVPQSTTAYTATSVDGFPGPAGSSGFGNGWPFDEGPSMLNDGLATTKYLNFNKTAAGAILYYTAPITANRIRLTSANDAPERDPALIRIEGRNYVSGVAQPFQMIHTGLAIPAGPGRGVMQELGFDNTSSYKDYRVTFLAVQNNATATAVQVAELTFVNDTAAAAVTTTAAGPRLTGSGDFWAPPGTVLTAGSAPSVSGGIGSLALKGYTGGTGSVVPFDTRGVTTKAITLNSASTIIWDYARTTYPETVTIGNFVTFSTVTGIDATNVNKLKTPDGGVTLDVPANSTWLDMQTWDQVGQKLYPLRPGKFTVEFENLAAPEDVTQNVIVEVTAVWPGSTDYNHILEAPAVDVDPSDTDNRAFQKIAYTEAAGTVSNAGLFSNTEEGRSVLLFSQRAAGVAATGNLTLESLSVKTVRSQFWKNAIGPKQNATIGTAITTVDHDINAVGHNGYVLTRLAPVNFGVYDPSTKQGPIIPVNIEYPSAGTWSAPDSPGMCAIAWFQVVDGLTWPYKAVAYTPQWPASPPRIVISSQLGSESLKDAAGTVQEEFTAPAYNAVTIYNQPDPAKPGYNPNEEHALVAPSFLNASRNAAYALRNDLNRTALTSNYTSQPFVLVNYRDDTDPANPVQKMAVYAIQHEDSATTDARLPVFNTTYVYRYQGVAGTKLVPPYPLGIVIGATPQAETDAINVDPQRIAYYEDKTNQPWIISGDTDTDNDIQAVFYYPMRGDFWHRNESLGSPLRFGPATPDYNINYNTLWPADSGVLKAGETLTFSGGEYVKDHAGDNPPPLPLPGAVAWQSGRLAFDEGNPALDPATLAASYLVRVIPALSAREVPLSVSDMPDSLKPASGNVIVEGGLWRFKALDAGLQKRIYYNSLTGMLGVRGYLNGRTLGDPDLTAAPGPQTILQPNILTRLEGLALAALNADSKWTSAAFRMGSLSQDPEAVPGTSFGVGLAREGTSGVKPATASGPGIAVITNPRLLNPAYAPGLNSGYITIAENDDPALGDAPVVMHVIRVIRSEVYRGSLAPIYPENVFDEKITVRHTGDFGSDVDHLFFEWRYREEDGRALNPPNINLPTAGTPGAGDWQLFAGDVGLNEIQLSGASAALLTDNLFFCRYRNKDADGNISSNWSQWAGAANSRPPNPSSPSATTDAAYVAQLVAGWVKRVTDAVNVFDARISDFRNNDAPATYTSMIQQAGQRYEGPVAFNPTKDVIENYGMIELYQTVLERAKDLSIDLAPGTSGINTALLNAANRISQFYTLIGNEAYSDALDPTIGYSTQSSQYGALAPTIHAFQNQTADLLDEELSLLRGRGEVGARPAYNRLLWNFTNSQGEAAYALNYAISDVDNDGFIDADDAQRLYPQGHGDAWGHYTMALKGYADLFTNTRFSWDPRSELYQINGVVFNIDYLDERAFAEAAAARAKAGAEIVDLVYRQKYTENPAGQWQGYQDTNTDRAWGVYEWGQRAATGAYFDWAVGNALLPASDTTHEGIQKVDRSTVGGLGVLAGNAALIQGKVESADRGYNPLGLDPNVVPFDIDPVRVDRTSVNPATHFEQIYERAVAAAGNAITTWDHANQLNNLLRRTGASTEELRQQTKQQDLDYRNRLIELFGTPYAGTIGAGKAYPEGYQGPDLYLFPYVNTVEITEGVTVPRITTEIRAVIDGLLMLNKDTDPFLEGEQPLDSNYHGIVKNWFSQDYVDTVATFGYTSLTLDLPVTTKGYAFKAPANWGVRGSTGKIQTALADMIQAELELLQNTEAYEGVGDDLKRLTRLFTAKTGIGAEDIRLKGAAVDNYVALKSLVQFVEAVGSTATHTREFTTEIAEGIEEGVPETWDAFGSIIKGALKTASVQASFYLRYTELLSEIKAREHHQDAENLMLDLETEQMQLAYRSEALDLLEQIEAKVNTEPDVRLLVFRCIEKLRSAGERYRSLLAEGERLVEERIAFNQRVASTTTKQRYEDMTFRVTRNDALRKYRSAFDLASRYAYLAGKAYAYDLNLPDNHAANNTPLLADIIRTRDLGVWQNGQPVLAHGGLASELATLKGNYDHFKGQMGFNNPSNQIYTFSLRADLGRVPLSTREDAAWRQKMETWRVPDLWNYTHSDGTTNYGFIYRRFCRPFAAEFNGSGNPVPQPALVIPFTSTIQSGKNWFDNNLAAGDSALNPSEFATKIRAVGVRFDSYNTASLSVTPQVYLIPLGADRMFMPESTTLQTREWNVVDQRIPAPLPITPAQLSNLDWHPFTGSTSGYFDEIRKFSSFRAFPDAVGTTRDDIISSSRLVGRSAWNTKWVLIIPNASLLFDAASSTAGLNTFIHGLPKSGESQISAGTDPAKRDLLGVRDIKLMLQTYSVSGN
jgi:hypothetical protein